MSSWNGQTDCIACAKERPQLGKAPFRLTHDTDPTGLQCMLQQYKEQLEPNIEQCKTLSLLYPPVKKGDIPP